MLINVFHNLLLNEQGQFSFHAFNHINNVNSNITPISEEYVEDDLLTVYTDDFGRAYVTDS